MRKCRSRGAAHPTRAALLWFNLSDPLTRDPRLAAALRYGPLVAAVAALVLHSLAYNFVTDDAYITFVYARNLAEHGALTFNLGDPVEGYTNFLWAVVLGVLALAGLAPEITSLVLGTGFAAGTLIVVYRLGAAVAADRRPSPWDHVAPALLALTAGYACWASGGLETQMFTFWVAAAIGAAIRQRQSGRYLRVGVFLALAALTRPEGLLVAGCIGAWRLVDNWARERRLAPVRGELFGAAVLCGVVAAHLLWRWWYYGYPLPNTYYVKAAGETARGYGDKMRAIGLCYVWEWARQSHAIWASPLIVLSLLSRTAAARSLAALCLLITAVYLGYTVSVGGDFMGLHRFVMPVFVTTAIGAALGARRLAALLGDRRGVSIAVAAVLLVAHGAGQLRLTARSTSPKNLRASCYGSIDTPAYLELYTRDRARIGRHMRECFADGDFSIFGGVGAKPYYARAEGIDVFGLVSERIAHEVKRTRPRPGHNKWGPDPLLAEHDPDFVFSCYSLSPSAQKPRWNCNPRWWERRGYRRVTLHIPGLRERGEYYSFLAREGKPFSCPGLIE